LSIHQSVNTCLSKNKLRRLWLLRHRPRFRLHPTILARLLSNVSIPFSVFFDLHLLCFHLVLLSARPPRAGRTEKRKEVKLCSHREKERKYREVWGHLPIFDGGTGGYYGITWITSLYVGFLRGHTTLSQPILRPIEPKSSFNKSDLFKCQIVKLNATNFESWILKSAQAIHWWLTWKC
jgi:hypothetical protein